MSVRQGNDILAGGVVCDNTPTSSSPNAVSSGGVYTALAGKVNTGHEVIDFQAPTADNNYTWYRKYADGWVEQGGYIAATGSNLVAQPVTLPIAMSNANYDVQKTYYKGADSSSLNWRWVSTSQSGTADTTTTVYISMISNSYVVGCHWEVRGMAA